MSVQRNVKSSEQKTREKKIKKMTGYETDRCCCSICKKQFTDREIDNDEIIYSIGKLGSIMMHIECFKKEYFGGQYGQA